MSYRGRSLQMWRVTLRADALTNRRWRLCYGDPTSILVQWYSMANRCYWCYRCVRACVCFRSSCRKSRAGVAIPRVIVVVLSLSLALALALFCLQLRHNNMNLLSPVLILLRHFTWNPLLQCLHGVSEWPWRGGWKHFAHSSLLRMVEGVDIL